ncbi:hypothetical protein YYC_00291 [Plasmodium yoelii 17X]|uniref:Uncharacterized protein n=4 Tax=Plasmodium yoelii TaxID=5861 RepID=A0AAE9WY82_PLAYO|nr:conserved Plasmodium protein, unknown function [Plasmodium yoelii]EAA19309.1 hypothetical protein [Plasmodium yoelii yoelii]ETB62563.1 hypothetical protein YYC_00291 [Plasmodium yoelii 17X]WBY60444.1 hypothetical protein Py17XNL_001303523 [Plasmodium yoelii yoelii]CDU20303.1 conserved Plasmodium protein, unknown function [Plasmodium yoelii]VTZ81061.1 conserved Plasmodium protein, unknown function [Plasmodium yoelii]|eukprot:XP_727744.1 conserved Plasmodium protein, unknown function [Plasmodium yoelii]
MDNFLIKLKQISEQYNNLLLEKKIIDKRIANVEENINKYEEVKQKSIKEVELKKNQLLKNKNKHLIKCQKMEQLNNKLNEILIRKQSIDDEEEKKIIIKQIDTINNTYNLLKNVQKLNDAILKDDNNYYKIISEQINNNGFTNKKILNMLNCFIVKSRINIHEKDSDENISFHKIGNPVSTLDTNNTNRYIPTKNSTTNFKIIQTNEIIKKLIYLFSNEYETFPLEKQQFLFVLLMNVLKHVVYQKEKIVIHDDNDKDKSNQIIHNFLYHNYILL